MSPDSPNRFEHDKKRTKLDFSQKISSSEEEFDDVPKHKEPSVRKPRSTKRQYLKYDPDLVEPSIEDAKAGLLLMNEFHEYLNISKSILKEDSTDENKERFRLGKRVANMEECFEDGWDCTVCGKNIKNNHGENRRKHFALHNRLIFMCPYGADSHICPVIHYKQEMVQKHIAEHHKDIGKPLKVDYLLIDTDFMVITKSMKSFEYAESRSRHSQAHANYLKDKVKLKKRDRKASSIRQPALSTTPQKQHGARQTTASRGTVIKQGD